MDTMSSDPFSQFGHFFGFPSEIFHKSQRAIFVLLNHGFGSFVDLFSHADSVLSGDESSLRLRCSLMEKFEYVVLDVFIDWKARTCLVLLEKHGKVRIL